MSSNYRPVYSTDPKDRLQCDRCGKLKEQCRCQGDESFEAAKIVAVFRLESNGRGGKTVTVLDNLPKNEVFLKELTKELKIRCGAGGTYKLGQKFGAIEIQGDKRVQMKAVLAAKNIKYKGM